MRPEHIEANKLVDLAHTGDRHKYRDALIDLEKRVSPVAYDSIKRQAAMQFRMETKDCRYTGWRADWLNDKRGDTNATDTKRAGGKAG